MKLLHYLFFYFLITQFAYAQSLTSNSNAYQQLQIADKSYYQNLPNALLLYQIAEQKYTEQKIVEGQIAAKLGQSAALLKQNKLKEAFAIQIGRAHV